jgi:enamine deaminase RidA (YjgF/YER057c/UK114 family)
MTGVTSVDDDGKVVGAGDMTAQVKQIYSTLGKILSKNNLTFEHVVKEVIYVTDGMAFFGANQIRVDVYKDLLPPAITAVEVAGLFNPDLVVEIDITAICS